MGLFSKLKFWKKEDEFDFDKTVEQEAGAEKPQFGAGGTEFGAEAPAGSLFGEERAPFSGKPEELHGLGLAKESSGFTRDLELISSKLDTVKALLNSLDQRVANLEKAAGVSTERKERLW